MVKDPNDWRSMVPDVPAPEPELPGPPALPPWAAPSPDTNT